MTTHKTTRSLLAKGRIGDTLTETTYDTRSIETITEITTTNNQRTVTTETRSVIYVAMLDRYALDILHLTYPHEGRIQRETIHEKISTLPLTTANLNKLYTGLLAR